MPARSTIPIPDPTETIIGSTRRTVLRIVAKGTAAGATDFEPWLPDITGCENDPEVDLGADAVLNPADFPMFPGEAPTKAQAADYADDIAQWFFNTYSKLVRFRIGIYNKWRKVINAGGATQQDRGKYRQACRLATEQMLRRDLPYWDRGWGYYFSLLPIYEIDIQLTVDKVFEINSAPNPNYETVTFAVIRGVAELSQHVVEVGGTAAFGPTWSSSSSSSSSSSESN